jgi:hypothetical protein
LETDDTFDAVDFSGEEIDRLVDFESAGDEIFDRIGPFLAEGGEVFDGILESLFAGVDGSVNDLIFEDEIAHDEIGVDLDGRFSAGNTGEDENGVGSQDAHDIECQVGCAYGFVNEIDVADGGR